ncbi:MAG: polysaccharide biosynthesis/export family protein [Alphaproteobacteria bacterium]|nr:polysaccharide biosynthesis/export family protein [Alphaproteobacteria bacterium]
MPHLLVALLWFFLAPALAQGTATAVETSDETPPAAEVPAAEAPAEVPAAEAPAAEAPAAEVPAAEVPAAEVPAAPPPLPSTAASAAGYKVGPRDVLDISVYGEEGLTGEVPVDDQGAIELPLLGSVHVGGLTTPEVASLLRGKLAAGFLVEPQVTVRIEAYGSQPIQVLGAVQKPGTYIVRGEARVLDMLSQAGGVSGDGVNEVRITRADAAGEVMVVPYLPLVARGEGNVRVAGGDVVFVPESLVYVMGEVGQPGSVAWREGLTVSRCIAASGGALSGANLGRVWILRNEERIRVNVRRILRGKEEDIPVQTGDQIFVQTSVF